MMHTRISAWIAALCLAGFAVGCGKAPEKAGDGTATGSGSGTAAAPVKVELQLNWFPEAEHGGYYQAVIAGLYKEAGLDVTLLKGGPKTPVETQVATGRIPFGIVNADKVLLGRKSGMPIVALMAPFQTSPRCIIVKDGAPYQSLADLKETTLVANQTKPFVAFLKQKYNYDSVQIVPYGGGMAQFINNDNFAIQGYVTSEPLTLEKKGIKTRSFLVADVGYNPYTSVLITNETMLRDNPELVKKMVAASVAGWNAYLASPSAANVAIQAENPEIELDVLNYGAAQQRDLMLKGDAANGHFGMMTQARWQELARQLVQFNMLGAEDVVVPGCFTVDYLPAPAAAAPAKP